MSSSSSSESSSSSSESSSSSSKSSSFLSVEIYTVRMDKRKEHQMKYKLRVFTITIALLFLLCSFVSAENVILEWNANTEADLAGYKIYSAVTSGGPYVFSGPGLPADATETTRQVSVGIRYWVLTVYDAGGNESGYSNEVSYEIVVDYPPVVPILRIREVN